MPDTVTHAFQRVAAELFNELLQVCSGIPQNFFINLQCDDFRFQKIAYFNASISTNGHVENHLYSNLGIRHTCYKEFVIGHNRDIMKSIQWSQRIRYTQVLLYLYIYNVNLVSLRLVYYFVFSSLDRAINTGSFSTGGGSTDPMTSSRDFAAFQTTWKQLWSGEATAKPTFSKVFTYVDTL